MLTTWKYPGRADDSFSPNPLMPSDHGHRNRHRYLRTSMKKDTYSHATLYLPRRPSGASSPLPLQESMSSCWLAVDFMLQNPKRHPVDRTRDVGRPPLTKSNS